MSMNRVAECSLLVRQKPGLGKIVLEVLNASEGHNAFTLCSTPAERFLGFVWRAQIWIEGDLPPLLAPWKWIGLILPIRRGVHVH